MAPKAILLEKLVPISASVTKDGVVVPAHYARRHVKPKAPPRKTHSQREEERASRAIGDLFDLAPAAAREPDKEPDTKPAEIEEKEVAPEASADKEPAKPKKSVKELSAESGARFQAIRDAVSAEFEANGRVSATLNSVPGVTVLLTHGTGDAPFRVTHFENGAPTGHNDYQSVAEAAEWEFCNTSLDANPKVPPAAPEPPPAAPENHIDYAKPFDPATAPSFGVAAGTSREQRRAINAKAIALVQSGKELGPDDLAVLRQYSGNGGCGDSLNEYYTDPKVAAATWSVLAKMGFGQGTKALEPSCATGVFLATAPAGVSVTGVELDGASSAIAAKLHPGHEIQNSSLESFANQDTRLFDVVIGNAPFGLRGGLIKDDKPKLKTAEGYFMDTAMDKLRPGGVVAMIVPTGIMDSKRDRKLREVLLRKGEFLGAVRMPNTAFEHSHTEVTADILFFRKRDLDVAGALQVVDQAGLQKLGLWDDEYLAGEYFTGRGAENVLGTMTAGWRAQAGMGDDITVEGSMLGVPAEIAEFVPETPPAPSPTVAAILEAAPDDAARDAIRSAALKRPYEEAKRGDIKTIEGVKYILEGQPLRWHRVDEFMQSPAVTAAQQLSQEIEAALQGGEAAPDLADRIRGLIEAHGLPSKNPDVMLAAATDKTIYRLIGAVKQDGTLSDLVENRKPAVVESSFDAAAQSLALENTWFKPEQVAARWHGGDTDTVLDHLYASPDYALDPVSGLWTSLDQYTSGELWPKLDDAKAALAGESLKPEDRAKLERQAALLEETIAPKLLEDVEVMLNSAFLPMNVIAAFFNDQKAALVAEGNEWARNQDDMAITFDKGVYSVTGGMGGVHLLGQYLNRSGVRKDDLPTINKWNEAFKAWLCASKYREEIEELYNRKFRGFRQRAYSDKPFDIPGLNPEGLKSHVYSGIRCALESGKGILADDVGLGKTVQGLILARMAKVTGNAKKPVIVVPKSVLVNWMAEAEKWFPGSSVLTIGETITREKDGKIKGRPDTAEERNRKYHDLTQNDYDFVFMSQPAWNDLDLDPLTKGQYVEGDFWVQRGDSLGKAGSKKINKMREAYNQATADRDFLKRTDAIYFNDLGIDMVIGDEFHAFKNLYTARNRFGKQPKFLGATGEPSKRAIDTNLKSRWVREQNGGKNIYGLTATPTKNSPLEIYSMLSHIAPEAFEKIGVRNSEEFLDRFCEFKQENVLTTSGAIEEALVTVGFKNMDELREIMRRFINRRTADDVGLILPKRDDRMHFVEMSAEQKSVYEALRAAATLAKGKKDAKGDAHIFSIMDKMGKAAMDLELLDSGKYAGADSPKYDAAVKEIAAGAVEGGQVVFADSIGVHDKLAAKLVASGIPRDRIAIMNAQTAPSATSRQNISDAFNAGKLDVVIGNTATMGEGQNLQKRTTDLHHLDLPWDPASLQQRNGRGLRQGNKNEAIRIHTYISKGSFDGYRYQSMSAKKDWQDLLWNGGDRVENLAREGNMSRDDLMVMLAADPEQAREALDKNKAAAELKFKAEKHGAAAADFTRFQEMRRSYGALKNKNTKAGERLRVTVDRLRTGLEQNPYFKPKHALDAKTPVLIQPTTGDAYEAGAAFKLPKDSKAVAGGGKFVVVGIRPNIGDAPLVQVRRYGAVKTTPILLGLDELDHAKQFAYDQKAEHAEISAAIDAEASSKVGSIKGIKDLHGMPPAVIHANYDTIQRTAKEGAKSYDFDLGYGAVGLINKEGHPVAAEGYDARGKLDDHDLMLPTDAHRQMAMDAYIADELGKDFKYEYAPAGRRGRATASTGSYKMRYPGKYGMDGHANRWESIGNKLFGDGFEKEAKAKFERQQFEAARHAKDLPDAIGHLWRTATGQYGATGAWPKRALALLWAKAKRAGKLDATFKEVSPPGLRKEAFGTYSGYDYGDITGMPIRKALVKMAKERGYSDLAAVMAAHAGGEESVKDMLKIGADRHVGAGLRHILGKHPELAGRPASEFADIRGPMRAYDVHGGGASPGHPLHQKFGDKAHHMTLGEVADGLTEQELADAA